MDVDDSTGTQWSSTSRNCYLVFSLLPSEKVDIEGLLVAAGQNIKIS